VVTAKVKLLPGAVCCILIIGLAACKGAGEQAVPEQPVVERSHATTQEDDSANRSMILNEQISFSKKDLADRLGSDPDSILLLGVREVTWRSGAIGCPKPGMSYTQALVPGVLILLEVDDHTFAYHAKTDGTPLFCPRGRSERPAQIKADEIA
jgi:hypothetical protein